MGYAEKEITIDGQKFFVGRMGGVDSFKLQFRIMPIVTTLGEAIESLNLPETADGKFDLEGLDLQTILPQIGKVLSKASPEDFWSICSALLSRTQAVEGAGSAAQQVALFHPDGKPNAFDRVMSGGSMKVWNLLWEALQISYPDFMKALAPVASPASAGTTQNASKAPSAA